MTNEKAIQILDRRTTIPGDDASEEEINEAINKATKALHIVELIEKAFERDIRAGMDYEDWSEMLSKLEEGKI